MLRKIKSLTGVVPADAPGGSLGDVNMQARAADLSTRLKQAHELKPAEMEQEATSSGLPLLYQADLDEHRRHPVVADRLRRVQQISIRRQYRRL